MQREEIKSLSFSTENTRSI